MLQTDAPYAARADLLLLALCAVCSALSVVVLVSVGQSQLGGSNNKASVQLIASLLGVMLAVIASTVDYRTLARAWPLHAVTAWGLVLPTLFLHNFRAGFLTIGYDAGGTSNYSWYRVGGMTFQPTELAKISFVLTLALHLERVRGRVNKPQNLLALLVHILLPVAGHPYSGGRRHGAGFSGHGAGHAVCRGTFPLAGGRRSRLCGGRRRPAACPEPGILKGYQFQRILAVLNPDDRRWRSSPTSRTRGPWPSGPGGLTGQGLFSGEHIFVPNAWNDFIFSYLANVLGFVGAAAVLILLFAIGARILTTALHSMDALGRYICVGIFAALFLQCIINLGMNLQVLPVIGVTLPFFSAGGSSVVMMYLCIGLVLSISLHNRRRFGIVENLD